MNEDEQNRLWTTLKEINDNVQKIDKSLAEHVAESKSINEKIEDHQKKLYGNGKDGLILTVDRLDKAKERSNKLTWVILAALVPLLLSTIWNNFFVKPVSQQSQNTAVHANNKTP